MNQPIEIQVHAGVREIPQPVWDRVVAHESPFLEWAFLHALEVTDCVGEEAGWIPQILTARLEDEVVGVVPLYLKTNSQGEFIFDWSWADAATRAGIAYYPKGLVAVPFSPVTGARLVVRPGVADPHRVRQALIQGVLEVARALRLSSVHFNFLNSTDRDALAEAGLPIRHSVQFHWHNEGYQSFDDYLGALRSKRRANIRRERRLLEGAGVTTRVLTGDELRLSDLQRAYTFYRRTVDKFYWGRRYLNEAFFEELHGTLRDRLHLVVAEHHGEPFAGAFNLLKGDRLYGRYWGCTRDIEFTHFEVCMYRPIAWCIEHGIQAFEPGAGGEHKHDRGFRATAMYSAHWIADPRLRLAVEDFIAREGHAVEQQIEWMDAQGPFKRDDRSD